MKEELSGSKDLFWIDKVAKQFLNDTKTMPINLAIEEKVIEFENWARLLNEYHLPSERPDKEGNIAQGWLRQALQDIYQLGVSDGEERAIEIIKAVTVQPPNREGEEAIYNIKRGWVFEMRDAVLSALHSNK